MGRAAVSVAAEEMVALQRQHHPHLCPFQARKILESVHRNMEFICTVTARHSLESLLFLLIKWRPKDTVMSLLKITPSCDRYQPRQPWGLVP